MLTRYDIGEALDFAAEAEALVDAGRPLEALPLAEAAIQLAPLRAEGFAARGRARRALRQNAAALSDLDALVERTPDAAAAHEARGVLLAEAGEFEHARRAFETAIGLNPRFARAHFGLAMLGEVAADQRAALEALASDAAGLDARERLFLLYALAKAYDEAGDVTRAFAAAETGARLRRVRWSGDERRETQRLIDARPDNERSEGRGVSSEAPVFVFGMPRSGTTLVEQILGSHSHVFALGETEAFATESARGAHALAAAYFARWPQAAREAHRVVDKSLGNILEIAAIRRALPRAKLVHVRRDPLDCCVSCFFSLFSDDMPFAPDLAGIGGYYRGYSDLMARWRAVLPRDVFYEVDYERLISASEAEMRALLAFCGLEWEPQCLAFYADPREVRTASFAQVRRPLYTSAIGRAAKYEAFLQPLKQALQGLETQA